MGFLDRFRNNGYYNEEQDAENDYDGYEGEEEEEEDEDAFASEPFSGKSFNEAPAQQTSRRQTYAAAPKSETTSPSNGRVLNIHATAQLQVVIRKPETMDDALDIADHLLERHTVVVNLESTDKQLAKRIIDFLSGVSYANHGALTKVANATFVVTPYNVGLIGQDVIGELENSGVFF